MILGPGEVVGDSLSGREDGCESYECVLRHHGPAFAIRGWRGAGAAGADYALFWPRFFFKTRFFYFPLNDSWTPSGCSRILPALRNASGATLPPLTLPPVLTSGEGLQKHQREAQDSFEKNIFFNFEKKNAPKPTFPHFAPDGWCRARDAFRAPRVTRSGRDHPPGHPNYP